MTSEDDDKLVIRLTALLDLRDPPSPEHALEVLGNLPRPLTLSERTELKDVLDRTGRVLDRYKWRTKRKKAKLEEKIRELDETLSAFKMLQKQNVADLMVSSLIIPEGQDSAGVLMRSTSLVWNAIVRMLGSDWELAYQISSEKWEELVAGAYTLAGYDTVLTPRSGDHGRDVIAVRRGVGCVKIIGSVKAYRPGHLVEYDDVRALLGVLSGERD